MVDHYNLTYAAYGKDSDSTTYLFNVVITIDKNSLETIHKKYTMVSTDSAPEYEISLEGLSYTDCGSYGMRYAIQGDYLICDYGTYAGENNSVELYNTAPNVSVTAVDAEGTVLGIVVVK